MLYREQMPYENVRGGLLLHEMGLGKSICALSTAILAGGRTLCIVPAQLVYVWESEIKRHLQNISYFIYHGPNRKKKFEQYRLDHEESDPQIMIMSYQSVPTDIEDEGGPLMNISFHRLIYDECHYIKNQHTQIFRAVSRIKAPVKWFISGTPIMNRIHEMYPYLKLLNYKNVHVIPQRMLRGRNGFQPFNQQKEIKVSTNHYKLMQQLLRNIAIRRTKSVLSLPEKTVYECFVEMNEKEKTFYQTLKTYSSIRIRKLMLNIRRITHSHLTYQEQGRYRMIVLQCLLSLLFHLRLACCDPVLVIDKIPRTKGLSVESAIEELQKDHEDDCPICCNNRANMKNTECGHVGCKDCWTKLFKIDPMRCFMCFKTTSLAELEDYSPPVDKDAQKQQHVARVFHRSSKTRYVLDKLKEELKLGKKVIIVSQWTTYLDKIVEAFRIENRNIPYVVLDGRTAPMKRQKTVDAFQDDDRIKVCFASLGSSSEGITLHAACSMIVADVYWNLAKTLQISNRLHRIGQTRPVSIHCIYIKDSIEVKLKELIEKKDVICKVIVDCAPINGMVESWLTRVIKLAD